MKWDASTPSSPAPGRLRPTEMHISESTSLPAFDTNHVEGSLGDLAFDTNRRSIRMKNDVSTLMAEADPKVLDIIGDGDGDGDAELARHKERWRRQVAQKRSEVVAGRLAGQPAGFDLKYLTPKDDGQAELLSTGSHGIDAAPMRPNLDGVESTHDRPGKNSTGDPELDDLLAELDESEGLSDSIAASATSSRTVSPMVVAEGSVGASVATPKSDDPDPVPPKATSYDSVVLVDPAAESSTAPSSIDRFPVTRSDDVPNVEDPGRELAALCREVREPKDYLAARDRYCLISIRMNLDGLFAPAFRHRPHVQAPKDDAIHMQMHRDRLVIDYHWCHATGMQLSPTDPDHAHLLDLEHDFDFVAAWSLALRNQSGKYRAAEALCLTPLHQCQTMTLHGLELKARLEHIHKTYRKSKGAARGPFAKAITAIGQWAERNKRIEAERVSYEKLWLARAMLGEDGTDQAIAALHALMLGKSPLHRKTIAGKLATLKRNVDVALKPTTTP